MQQAYPGSAGRSNLRPPSQVMRLARMGCFHASRLSFLRVLLRRMKQQNWRFTRPIWRIDDKGVGVATYQMDTGRRQYTLIAFAHDLPAELRSDRVIAEAWDATFTLFDGVPTEDDILRLSKNVPLQEAGRVSQTELSLSRANRSVRLFQYVVGQLAKGEQPEQAELDAVGYLMRTTAVYGAAKFGAADRDTWADREEFLGSFQPEMLSVWLTRAFTIDLVEHLAKVKAPDTAVPLEIDLRRSLGVGNSTGLGMAPFLINHPALLNAWIEARETAFAKVREQATTTKQKAQKFTELLSRAQLLVATWNTQDERQARRVEQLTNDLADFAESLNAGWWQSPSPWQTLWDEQASDLSAEAQEMLVSLMIDVHGELVDDLAQTMCADEARSFRIDGSQTIAAFRSMLEEFYSWIADVDFGDKPANARVWYVSEEKLEPRLGERFEEPLELYEQPLSPARDIERMKADLEQFGDNKKLGAFLMKHPHHRHVARRVQIASKLPYAEIRDNTIDAEMVPIDLLRCKLSFFGATKFDPKSDRWTRISLFQGAPFPHELADCDPDDMAYPPSMGN